MYGGLNNAMWRVNTDKNSYAVRQLFQDIDLRNKKIRDIYCYNQKKDKKLMIENHRRHGMSDRVWGILENHLPERKGSWGGIAIDNRTFINAVFWILRT